MATLVVAVLRCVLNLTSITVSLLWCIVSTTALRALHLLRSPHITSWTWLAMMLWPGWSKAKEEAKRKAAQPDLLPQQEHRHQGKLVVVLDLDETLIASFKLRDVPAWMLNEDSLHTSIMTLPYGSGITDCSKAAQPSAKQQSEGGHRYTKVMVVVRPGAREFLRRLSMFAELVVFSAAVPQYAEPVVRLLDPDGSLFQGRLLYRQHTQVRYLSTPGGHNRGGPAPHCIKDLGNLGRDLSRVVLVDNNPLSFLHQPANGVPCLPFRGDPTDYHLPTVLLPLLQSLALFRDVRPILDARFRMTHWFTQRGLPARADASLLQHTRDTTRDGEEQAEMTYSPGGTKRASRPGSSSMSRQHSSSSEREASIITSSSASAATTCVSSASVMA